MASLKSKFEQNKSSCQLTPSSANFMVGLLFRDGVLLATDMTGNLIYYLADRIYCCGSNTSFDREAQLEVATKLEDVSSVKDYKASSVNHALDLLAKKYDQTKGAELLLVGVDEKGLHLYAFRSYDVPKYLKHAALGTGSAAPNEYIAQHWRADMELREAEQLARNAAQMANVDACALDICVIFKLKEKKRSW